MSLKYGIKEILKKLNTKLKLLLLNNRVMNKVHQIIYHWNQLK